MDTVIQQSQELDEQVWRSWIEKRKLNEQASARKMRMAGGIALVVIALVAVGYRLFLM
jgi:Tfp pilus assembly protein PilN